jgi:LysR family transcriptional regulator, low CO2-responsive transcriptional regulator
MSGEATPRMDTDPLPHLDTFAEAAERSSFTAAARALGLTQAAVSQRVASLEHELGVALFDRRGGRVLLTEAGRRLHDYARRILALHRQARQEVGGRALPVTGELSLAASSVPGEHLLPALLAAFRARHPHVQVRATVHDSRAVIDQVEQGEAHLGLLGGKGDSPHLEYRRLGGDELTLVVPPGHPWGRRKRVSLDELAGQPLVLREVGSGSRWCLEQGLARAGKPLTDLRVALELGSNEAIKEAVLRGLGLAFLSRLAVEKELRAGQLAAVRVDGLRLAREMFAVSDRRRALPIPARLFLDLLATDPGAASG